MKIGIIIILIVILIAVLTQVYFIAKERNQLKAKLSDLNIRSKNLLKENANIASDIKYFSYPENLEKELRQRFNYKKPGEKMMIITP